MCEITIRVLNNVLYFFSITHLQQNVYIKILPFIFSLHLIKYINGKTQGTIISSGHLSWLSTVFLW